MARAKSQRGIKSMSKRRSNQGEVDMRQTNGKDKTKSIVPRNQSPSSSTNSMIDLTQLNEKRLIERIELQDELLKMSDRINELSSKMRGHLDMLVYAKDKLDDSQLRIMEDELKQWRPQVDVLNQKYAILKKMCSNFCCVVLVRLAEQDLPCHDGNGMVVNETSVIEYSSNGPDEKDDKVYDEEEEEDDEHSEQEVDMESEDKENGERRYKRRSKRKSRLPIPFIASAKEPYAKKLRAETSKMKKQVEKRKRGRPAKKRTLK